MNENLLAALQVNVEFVVCASLFRLLIEESGSGYSPPFAYSSRERCRLAPELAELNRIG